MARQAFSQILVFDGTRTYTVPSGKYLVCAAHRGSALSYPVRVDGVIAFNFDLAPDGNGRVAPLVFRAGQVISIDALATSGNTLLTGFLYDA